MKNFYSQAGLVILDLVNNETIGITDFAEKMAYDPKFAISDYQLNEDVVYIDEDADFYDIPDGEDRIYEIIGEALDDYIDEHYSASWILQQTMTSPNQAELIFGEAWDDLYQIKDRREEFIRITTVEQLAELIEDRFC